jgi:hypothetical protein
MSLLRKQHISVAFVRRWTFEGLALWVCGERWWSWLWWAEYEIRRTSRIDRQDFGSVRRPIIAMSPFAGLSALLTTDEREIRNDVD